MAGFLFNVTGDGRTFWTEVGKAVAAVLPVEPVFFPARRPDANRGIAAVGATTWLLIEPDVTSFLGPNLRELQLALHR